MDAELKAKWIAALRSGKYKQGQGQLKFGDEFCGIGVLADVAGFEWQADDGVIVPRTFSVAYHFLPSSLLPLDFQRRLARKNDTGATFAEIADIIEAEL